MEWTVPPMWKGRRVAILASGPSMSVAVAESVRAKEIPTIAINRTFEAAPWADVLYASDAKFWHVHWHRVAPLPGLKVAAEQLAPPGVHWLKVTGQAGFDPNPSFIRSGGNSGYAAIHVAAHAGATEIELHGFDMHGRNGVQHWHGTHGNGLRDHGEGIYAGWLKKFETLKPELDKLGVRVINCTPGSHLRCFEFAESIAA